MIGERLVPASVDGDYLLTEPKWRIELAPIVRNTLGGGEIVRVGSASLLVGNVLVEGHVWPPWLSVTVAPKGRYFRIAIGHPFWPGIGFALHLPHWFVSGTVCVTRPKIRFWEAGRAHPQRDERLRKPSLVMECERCGRFTEMHQPPYCGLCNLGMALAASEIE